MAWTQQCYHVMFRRDMLIHLSILWKENTLWAGTSLARSQGNLQEREKSNSSEVEGHRHHHDFIRDQANKHRDLCNQAIEMGKNKMEKYQQQAKIYQNEDRDTFEQFKKDFESTISIKKFANRATYIISRKPDCAMSISEIDVINGKITGEIYDHQKSRENRNEFNLSEIAFNQIRLAMEDLKREMSEFNLKCWYDVCVINKETKEIVKLFFPEESGPDGKIKADRKTFKAGEDGFHCACRNIYGSVEILPAGPASKGLSW